MPYLLADSCLEGSGKVDISPEHTHTIIFILIFFMIRYTIIILINAYLLLLYLVLSSYIQILICSQELLDAVENERILRSRIEARQINEHEVGHDPRGLSSNTKVHSLIDLRKFCFS